MEFIVGNKDKSKVTMNIEIKQKKGLARLIQLAGGKKWWLFSSMFLAVVATLLQFVPVTMIFLILSEIAKHAKNITAMNKDYLYTLGYICLGATAGYGALIYSSLMLSHIAAFNILYEIRVKLSKKIAALSLGFFTARTSGEIKKIMSEDVERIELFIAHHIPDITSAIIFPLIIVSYLFITDWFLAIAAILPIPIALFSQIKMFSSNEEWQSYHDSLQKMNSTVVEYVKGMPIIKVFNASEDSYKKLKTDVESFKNNNLKMVKKYSKIYPVFLTVLSSSLLFIIPAATFLLNRTGLEYKSVAKVLLFFVIGGGMFFPFLKLMFIGGFLKQISVGVDRIDNIMYETELENKTLSPEMSDYSIKFDNVSFAYKDNEVLNNISFNAKENTVTAIVGPSGAGKSTLGYLCARFWDIQKGEISIGGASIKDINIDELMNYVSFVFQDSFLFFDTIEENIRMGNTDASMDNVIQAAKDAQCHDFIEKLPKGYQTLVGEGGTYLSGGEAQRIGIARIMLKNTPILILDEATAYADPENEGKIFSAFSKLIKNKTVVYIAHKLSTIINADNIIVLDKGKIVQQGKHSVLSEKKGLYKNMWNTYSKAREWKIDRHAGGHKHEN